MHTPATIKKHPLHPLLVAFPIGLLTFSLISDLIALSQGGMDNWSAVALYTLGGGIVFALIAAVPGFIDLLSITEPRLKKIGIVHMIVNLIAVGIFILDFVLRLRAASIGKLPVILSVIGVLLISVGGWLGAELVHHFGVTVEEGPLTDRMAH
jgi:uncharacterized membrane protein